MKKAISAMLFAHSPLSRLPSEIKKLLPRETTATKVRSAILARHPGLAKTFEKGVGYKLMFMESQILVAVLLALNAKGITALPMHDGLMVPRSAAPIAKMTMAAIAKKQTGHIIPVVAKT
jgi:hypothetical protein